uniref:Ankyrin repeat domain 52a n=1 Tax=Lepisosteus oculatus TaxID=7918 RepID=W5MAW9_LEPOC
MGILNITDQPPLVQAIFNRNAEEVQLLLHKKEDVNALKRIRYRNRRMPSHYHTCVRQVVCEDVLTESCLNGASSSSNPSVGLAGKGRFKRTVNDKAVSLLLRQGAEINARDKFWQTPLHVAAANRATKCAEALIPLLNSVNVADRTGRTALHHAAHSGHVEMVNLLLNKGANLNASDKKERQPIHWAAYLGEPAVNRRSGAPDFSALRYRGWQPGLNLIRASLDHDTLASNPPRDRIVRSAGLPDMGGSGFESCLSLHAGGGRRFKNASTAPCEMRLGCNYCHGTFLHVLELESPRAIVILALNQASLRIGLSCGGADTPAVQQTALNVFSPGFLAGGEIDCVDKYGNTPLHVAAKYGHELLISTLMTNGADTARRGIHGMFPLHLAVLYGFSDCCRKLLSSGQLYSIVSSLSNEHVLSAGFDINTPDNLGRTCLHAAASGGNVECLNLLLSSGADLSKKDKFGRTPLHYAAANGSYQCTVALVSAGAEVNEGDNKGCTPLHYSAASETFRRVDRHYSGSHENEEERAKETFFCLEFLLDSGADPAVRNKQGYSAVHYAAAHGNKQNLELLLEMSFNCLEDVESSIPVSPLHLAAYNGHCEALRVLSETLVSLDVRDAAGRSALYLAAQKGHTDCVEVLVSHGASCVLKERHLWWDSGTAANGHTDCLHMLIDGGEKADVTDVMDAQGQTPLMLAVLGSHTDCVHLLLEKGATADAGDKRGRTALHRGAVIGCEDCVSALLDHDAFALCRDFKGRTPLHFAAACGHMELLGSLLQAAFNTDPLDSILDYSGYTPSHWASYHGHEDCLDVLLENKPFSIQEGNPFTPLHCALINGHDGAAELLVESIGAQIVNCRDAKGRTPLHAAAFSENVHGLQLMLCQGADVNAVDQSGRSALMVAADRGQTAAVEILLHRAKADLTLMDVNKNTALHLACSKGHEMCALLILGETHDQALINATNSALQMPLHIAARNGLATVVQVLLSRGATVLAVDEEGHTPALACAPNKDVADCLALILSTMKPFPPKDPGGSPFGLNLLKHCGIAAACSPLPNGNLRHPYAKERPGAIGLDGCFSE